MNWPIFKSTATPNIWCDFPQHAPFPWFSSLPSAYRMCAWVEMASTLRDQIPECLRWMSTSIAWVGRRNVSKPSWVTTGIPLVGWSCCTLTKKSGRWSNSHSTHRDVTRWLVREWSPHGLISAIFRLANFYIWVTHHSAERRFFGDNSAADHRRIHPVQPWDFRLLVLFRSESEASVATWNKLRFMIHCLVGSTCLFLLGPAISQVFASDLQLQSRFCLLVVGPLGGRTFDPALGTAGCRRISLVPGEWHQCPFFSGTYAMTFTEVFGHLSYAPISGSKRCDSFFPHMKKVPGWKSPMNAQFKGVGIFPCVTVSTVPFSPPFESLPWMQSSMWVGTLFLHVKVWMAKWASVGRSASRAGKFC